MLELLAAVSSGWPTVSTEAETEEGVMSVLARLEEELGPLPQADTFEPWEAGEPWGLRVVLPGLELERALQLQESLPQLEWRAGDPRGLTEQLDLARASEEWLEGHGWRGRLVVDLDSGALQAPDVRYAQATDPLALGLAMELAERLRQADDRFVLRGAAGPGTLDGVVHRETGRVGLHGTVAIPEGVELDPIAVRQQVAAVLGTQVAAGDDGDPLRLAPEGEWTTRLGALEFVLWLVTAPVSARPQPLAGHDPEALDRLLDDGSATLAQLELQVWGTADPVAEVAALLEASDLPWQGALPRWVHTSSGPRFASVWVMDAADGGRYGLPEVVSALHQVPGVEGARIVAGCPAGLELDWPGIEPLCFSGGGITMVRFRDALRDRDRLRKAIPREPGPEVEALAIALLPGLRGLLTEVRPVRDSAGREGVELALGLEAQQPDGQAQLLVGLQALPRAWQRLVALAHEASGSRARVWLRGPRGEAAPLWP